MKKSVNMAELDSLAYQLECAVAALNVTHEAMTSGGFALKTYIPAIFSHYNYLTILVDELHGMIEDDPKEATV